MSSKRPKQNKSPCERGGQSRNVAGIRTLMVDLSESGLSDTCRILFNAWDLSAEPEDATKCSYQCAVEVVTWTDEFSLEIRYQLEPRPKESIEPPPYRHVQ